MSSEYGKRLKISIFGQSHGKAIGVNIDGLPAGERIDIEELCDFTARRAPGKSEFTTKRTERDVPIFLSGLENGVTCASPMCVIIENSDAHSSDYSYITQTPRPSHADYTAFVKYGEAVDLKGGGHFSGRLTAPMCIAGGIAKQILARRGIYIGAHISSVAGEEDIAFPLFPTKELFESTAKKELPVISAEAEKKIADVILDAAKNEDSVGGCVECAVIGLAAGLGSPIFDGIENRLAAAVFGIPAVKGIEFGAGFSLTKMNGSQSNDPFTIKNGKIETETNNCGGILGGISNGMPIVFRAAFKPTPSIGKEQRTVNVKKGENALLTIRGRHDPCIAVRAVPVVEAVAATVILDMLLEEQGGTF